MKTPLLVQISMHYRPISGGQEVYISNLMDVLKKAGWLTRVIQPYRGVAADDIKTVPRIPSVARILPAFEEFQFAFFTPLIRARLLNEADVILCHYATSAQFISKFSRWRKKTIILSHGIEWNVDRLNSHDKRREQNAKNLFGKVTTVANDSDYLRRMGVKLEPQDGFYQEVTRDAWFIPNCVDAIHFCPPNIETKRESAPHLLVPRQICEDRGIHLAIESFAIFSKIHPESVMSIVGPKRDESYFAYCEKLVKELHLSDRVFFIPSVTNKEMIHHYHNATVTLIPTIRREGTSLSALESMACGTPVVLTDVAGLKDIPGIHTKADPREMAKALHYACTHRKEESIRQRQAIQNNFTVKHWTDAWQNVLNHFVNRS